LKATFHKISAIVITGITIMLFSFRVDETDIASPIHIKLKPVASGIVAPVGMACPADGSHRLFVIQQNGIIRIIKNNVVLPVPFLDIHDKLDKLNSSYSEKGLLGLAFHPDYKSNGRFFVYYSAPSADKNFDNTSIVAEYKVSATNPDVADRNEEIILKIPEPESNHNGGCLQFGKDHLLYISLGDGGGAGDKHGPNGNAQMLSSLLGKILRIDVNKKPYSIPADNPFVADKDAKPEIYAYGLRNPWRFSFDRVLGTLFCGDVGQDLWEEVDIIQKGKNYGWRIMEGTHCFSPSSGCDRKDLQVPITEYSHKEGVSICGGYMYRGKMFPSLHGTYFFGDWSGKIFYLHQNQDGNWNRGDVLAGTNKSNDISTGINSMGEDENGEIYILTQKTIGPQSATGAIYKIEL